jgi:zinc transport system substrate-binding protein
MPTGLIQKISPLTTKLFCALCTVVCALCALCTVCAMCASCGNGASVNDNTLTVSIEPLRFVVEQIVGDDFHIDVLTPPGASPETYEPTPLQIKSAEKALLVFSTGLIDFERVMLARLPSPQRFVDLSADIELIAGNSDGDSLGHNSEHTDNQHNTHANAHGGVDPHIWVAPRALARMAATAYGRIHELYPDSVSYTTNYERFAERLTQLDSLISHRLAASSRRAFMIFHPGLTYYARDYGLRQIALESDGKEPSTKQLAAIVELARAEKISKVLYQSEFPRRIVEVAAEEIGAQAVEIDILGYDIVGNILKITELIAEPASTTPSSDNPAATPSR